MAVSTGSAMAGSLAMAALALVTCFAMCNAQVDCSAEFTALAPCMDFVTSSTQATPSKGCCTAFSATHTNSPVCLCQLQQAFADPATAPGNSTRANAIPDLCAIAVDQSQCPGLLGLAPMAAPLLAPIVPPVKAPTVAPVKAPVKPPTPAVAVAPGPKGADVDCSAEFGSLAVCIDYINSKDAIPPADCCSALHTVFINRPVCLCQLLNTANGDPSATAGLNVTKALELPTVCKTGTDVTRCPALLGEPVASPVSVPIGALPGPFAAPAPGASAPAIITLPPATPDTTPADDSPNGNDATSILAFTPLAILASILASLHLLFSLTN